VYVPVLHLAPYAATMSTVDGTPTFVVQGKVLDFRRRLVIMATLLIILVAQFPQSRTQVGCKVAVDQFRVCTNIHSCNIPVADRLNRRRPCVQKTIGRSGTLFYHFLLILVRCVHGAIRGRPRRERVSLVVIEGVSVVVGNIRGCR
jgi:hypothetical protein